MGAAMPSDCRTKISETHLRWAAVTLAPNTQQVLLKRVEQLQLTLRHEICLRVTAARFFETSLKVIPCTSHQHFQHASQTRLVDIFAAAQSRKQVRSFASEFI